MPENVNLSFEASPKDIMITIDTEQIKRVLLNIFNNALQAMPSGGDLTIKIRVNSSSVEIDIIDTGIGIEQKYTAKYLNRCLPHALKKVALV